MEIEKIKGRYYNSRGMYWYQDSHGEKRQYGRVSNPKKPIDAITIEKLEIKSKTENSENEAALLTQLVKSLPDDYVKERIYQVRNTFPIIDDFLVEKLIMEEL